MGLLGVLGLTPSKAMLQRAAAAAAEKEETEKDEAKVGLGGALKPGAPLKSGGWSPKDAPDTKAAAGPGAEADDAARAKAQSMRSRLVAREKELDGVYKQIADGQDKLVKAIAKAPASSKPSLESQKKKWDEALDKAGKGLDQARRDVKALDDPTATRDELLKVAARAGAKGGVDGLVEVETAQGATDQKFNERKQVTTEATYKDGVARVEKNETSTSVGLDGVTKKTSKEVTQQWAGGATKVTEESQVKVGPGGISAEKKNTREMEFGDKKASVETTASAELGKDGIKLAKTVTKAATDGSSTEVAKEGSLDRGDGKLGASGSKQVVTTDADGNADTRKLGAKGGLLASDKGMGGYGSAEGSLSKTDKDGVTRGVVGGLHANMTCSIGDPKGEPALYPVTIEISLGAEITVNAGKTKKDSTDKRSAEITLGAEVVIRETRNLGADKLAKYVAAAEAASKGGQVADATLTELRILQAGVTHGWAVAQAMWKGGGKALSKETLEQLKNVGDSTEMATSKKIGGKVSGNLKAVSAEFGASVQEDESVKATRNAEGGLDVDASDSREDKIGGKLGGGMGVVSGSFGGSYTVSSGFGVEIKVAPDVKPDDPLFAALVACKTAAQYEAFILRYKAKIKVTGKIVSKAEASTSDVSLTVAGVTGTVGSGSGVAERAKYDADGKLIESTVVGQQQAGGSVSAGDFKFGDSAENTATAKRDKSGQSSLDLARKKNQSDAGKMVDAMAAKVGLGDDKGKEKKGVLQTLAGGEEADTQVHDVFGIRLTHKDLVALAAMAKRNDWAAPGGSNADDAKAWRTAQAAINAAGGEPSVVANELSRFVGGSKKDRLALLRQFLRPGGKVSIGMAYSFPDALASKQKDFEELVVKDCEDRVTALAGQGKTEEAVKLGNDLLGRLTQLTMLIKSSQAFGDKAAQADMVSKMGLRRTALSEALRKAQGKNSEADEKAARLEEFNRFVGNCQTAKRNLDEVCETLRGHVPSSGRMTAMNALKHIDTFNRMFDLRAMLAREMKAAQELADKYGFARRYETYRLDEKVIEAIKTAYNMRGPS